MRCRTARVRGWSGGGGVQAAGGADGRLGGGGVVGGGLGPFGEAAGVGVGGGLAGGGASWSGQGGPAGVAGGGVVFAGGELLGDAGAGGGEFGGVAGHVQGCGAYREVPVPGEHRPEQADRGVWGVGDPAVDTGPVADELVDVTGAPPVLRRAGQQPRPRLR